MNLYKCFTINKQNQILLTTEVTAMQTMRFLYTPLHATCDSHQLLSFIDSLVTICLCYEIHSVNENRTESMIIRILKLE